MLCDHKSNCSCLVTVIECDRLKTINANLLEALEDILPWVTVAQEHSRNQVDAAYKQALAAIANAKG